MLLTCVLVCSYTHAQTDSTKLIANDDSSDNRIRPVPAIYDNFKLTAQEIVTAPGFYPYSKRKVRNVAIANASLYTASMVGLYFAWYKDYPQGKFHSFNDFPEWKQVDKVGHMYSAYTMSKYSMELWRSTGISRNKRILWGGLTGAAFQTVIEVLDGFSTEWGWSWSDIGANILGSGAIMAQEYAWNEQRIQMKLSFHKKTYTDPQLNKRSNKLFGKSLAERALKDYNSQTYWLSVNLRSFAPSTKIPKWLAVAVGYGANNMFGGTENIGKDENGIINFDRRNIPRYSQWYLAPDVDLTKIKTNKKAIRYVLFVLNCLKFPSPAMELSQGKLKARWIVF